MFSFQIKHKKNVLSCNWFNLNIISFPDHKKKKLWQIKNLNYTFDFQLNKILTMDKSI